jgi:DNA-binding winged helix-turn-helix (wHTH) protein
MRLQIAVIRALVDELERSLTERGHLFSSLGQERADELELLVRALCRPGTSEELTADVGGPNGAPGAAIPTVIASPLPPRDSGRLPQAPSGGLVLGWETAFQAAARVKGGSAALVLRFEGFSLDLSGERLWKEGRELRVRRKPYAILRHFAQHPRRLVTRAEIIDAVWGKIAMCESLLRTHIRDLRRVIGDGLIETVVGRGYRFTADVEEARVRAFQAPNYIGSCE